MIPTATATGTTAADTSADAVRTSGIAGTRVVYVVGGDGYPPARVLAGLRNADALVATVVVGDRAEPGRSELIDLARTLGPVLEVDGIDELAAAADALDGRWWKAPVMALSDDVLVAALRLGSHLGSAGGEADRVDTARHKYRARALFAGAGLPGPRFALIESAADIAPALAEVGVPGVLKPVYGAGSCWVFRIDDPAQLEPLLRASWAEMRTDGYVHRSQMAHDLGFVYESYLVGDGGTVDLADYCSVEGIVCAGRPRVLGVSDRFPPRTPFRESGVVFPSARPVDQTRPAVDLALAVVDTLGMTGGAFHVEVKFTADGPMLIECNPRPGGPLPRMWERLTGRDFARAYVGALHGDDGEFAVPLIGACGEHLLYPPGELPGTLTRVAGLAELAQLPGVEDVEQWLGAGEVANPHEGDYSAVGRAWTWAPTPAGVVTLDHQLRSSVEIEIRTGP